MKISCLAITLSMRELPQTEPDDNGLVRAASSGDRRAFETLYRRHSTRVYGAIWRLAGRDDARAEDLTQEAFVRAWRKLSSFRFESAFSTWLHRLAVNLALMELRGQSPEDVTQAELLDAANEPMAPFCAGERVDLEQAVAKLPPRARAVLVLHDIEGWTHEEIGQELAMAVGSSKAQLHRARGLLKGWLGEGT